MKIFKKKSMENVILTCRRKDRERRSNLTKTSPSHRQRRVMEIQIWTPKSGVSFTRGPSTTLMNVARNSRC